MPGKTPTEEDRVAGNSSRNRHCWIGLLLALVLVRGMIYAVVIPPWQAPDETGHFEYAWLIAQLGRLPSREDTSPPFERELLSSLYEWRYGDFIDRPLPEAMPARMDDLPPGIFAGRSRTVLEERFSLSYLWQALFLLLPRSQDLTAQLLVARFSSILLNLGIVWLAFRTFSEMLPDRPFLVCSMTAVVVFLPQHTFINSTVGDGLLAELMACLVLYCWVLVFKRGITLWTVLGIAMGTLIAIWSKATAAFLLPLNVGLALWWFFRQPRRVWTWRHTAYLCISAIVLGIAAWGWSQFRFPSGSGARGNLWERLSADNLLWVDARGITFGEALLRSHDSLWAYFGWMTVPVSSRWYGALLLFSVVALLGWVLGRKEQDDFPPWSVKLMGGSFLAALVIFVATLLFQPSGFFQFQGRYLFPVIVPFSFLLVGGWVRLIPPQRCKLVIGSGVVFLALFDTWSLMRYAIPYFYSS